VIASLSEYLLTGEVEAQNYFQIDGTVQILVNGQDIYQFSDLFESVSPPISFSASSGDTLRVLAKKAGNYEHYITPLWLFKPDGERIKLYHGGIVVSQIETGEIFLDLNYIIP
jgi:hypothetical protein